MASIHKEGKYWTIHFRIGLRQYKRSLRTSSKRIAEKLKLQIEDDLAAGTFKLNQYSPQKQIHLSEFIQEALAYSATNKSGSTVIREKRIFNNFLNFVGQIPINAIKPKDIEKYKSYLQLERKFSPNGINIELRHLSAAFSLAVKYDYIAVNPFKSTSKVKTPKKLPVFLTKEQATSFLTFIKQTSLYEYVLISLHTGARVAEVVSLTWEDVNFENKLLKLKGKGSKERIVPIPSRLYQHLRLNQKLTGRVTNGSARTDQVTKNFRKWADRFGLKGFTFHNIRDTYASWLVQNGVNLKIIQELLGHEDIKTTLVYAHLAPDSRMQAIDILDNILPAEKEIQSKVITYAPAKRQLV